MDRIRRLKDAGAGMDDALGPTEFQLRAAARPSGKYALKVRIWTPGV